MSPISSVLVAIDHSGDDLVHHVGRDVPVVGLRKTVCHRVYKPSLSFYLWGRAGDSPRFQ